MILASDLMVPASTIAESVSILASLVGALYIAIVTGRIVGLEFGDLHRIAQEPDV